MIDFFKEQEELEKLKKNNKEKEEEIFIKLFQVNTGQMLGFPSYFLKKQINHRAVAIDYCVLYFLEK